MSDLAGGLVGTAALFVDGLLAGTFVGSTLIEHAMRTAPADAYLVYKQGKERVLGTVMPPFLLAAIVVSGAAAAITTAHATFGIVAAALVAILVVTIAVHLPINKAVMRWTPDTIPGDWTASRDRWRSWNVVRCALAVIAFAATLAA